MLGQNNLASMALFNKIIQFFEKNEKLKVLQNLLNEE